MWPHILAMIPGWKWSPSNTLKRLTRLITGGERPKLSDNNDNSGSAPLKPNVAGRAFSGHRLRPGGYARHDGWTQPTGHGLPPFPGRSGMAQRSPAVVGDHLRTAPRINPNVTKNQAASESRSLIWMNRRCTAGLVPTSRVGRPSG